jgi:hypothetical protein
MLVAPPLNRRMTVNCPVLILIKRNASASHMRHSYCMMMKPGLCTLVLSGLLMLATPALAQRPAPGTVIDEVARFTGLTNDAVSLALKDNAAALGRLTDATVFFASTATADYALSARFAERVSGYAPQQLEFLPYAAVYQVAAAQAATSVAAVTSGPAQSGSRGDPIGKVMKTSTFDRAQHINVGKSSQGKPVCFFREEGGSHMLDIGVSVEGAFIRVAHGDGPLPTGEIPKPPLRLFAGKGLTKVIDGDEKYTGEYAPIQTFGGSIEFVPNIATDFGDGFVVVSKDDMKSFFETVAQARREFVVIQSVSEPARLDRVAIYDFGANAISALLSCAKKHIR